MANRVHGIGFIGAGRMATALATGCVEKDLVVPHSVLACDPSEAARATFLEKVPGARVFTGPQAVLKEADLVFLAVKPQVMATALEQVAHVAETRHLFVSIAAGITLQRLAEQLPDGARVIRVMPNTPCLIGEGASCYSRGSHATFDDAETVRQVLVSVGHAWEVKEELLDPVTGLSGSGPAFVYSMIEGLVAGAERVGMQPELALQLAAQTARGASAMVMATGLSPAELRNQVTSPGGTTLAGLERLNELEGVQAFAEAVVAATERSRELGKG